MCLSGGMEFSYFFLNISSYINQSVDLLCKSTGFYMMGTLVVKGLTYLSYSQYNKKIHNHEKNGD